MNDYDEAIQRMKDARQRMDKAEAELNDTTSEYENAKANLEYVALIDRHGPDPQT
jgi:exonuclease VII small subunit